MPPTTPPSEATATRGSANLDQVLVTAFLENAPYRIYFKDRESRFLAVGRVKLLRHGFTDQTPMLGKTDADFFSAAHAQRAREDELQILHTGETVVGQDEKTVWPNGDTSWGRATKLPLRDAHGAIIGTFGYTEDVTREKELEHTLSSTKQDLIAASRTAGMAEVATGVLHNVGNVLNSLNVSTMLIESGLRQSKVDTLAKLNGLLREHMADLGPFLTQDAKGKLVPEFLQSLAQHFQSERTRMLTELDSLQKNIDHIKDIVAMQQNLATVAGVVESLDPTALMEDAARMNSSSLNKPGLRVERAYQPVPPVCADKSKVLQILVNLIRNSKRAIDDGPAPEKILTLRVELGPPGYVCLAVADNGVGIPPENLTRIFQHGFTTRRDGHGFGLHSGALAAREMKGSLLVSSAGSGRGAVFTLQLPIAEQPAATRP